MNDSFRGNGDDFCEASHGARPDPHDPPGDDQGRIVGLIEVSPGEASLVLGVEVYKRSTFMDVRLVGLDCRDAPHDQDCVVRDGPRRIRGDWSGIPPRDYVSHKLAS